MSAKHLLYFTASDHYVYRWSRRALELEAKFSADDAGVAAFRDYLRGKKRALFYLVADLAGEDFHEDQIPYLRGGDRKAVIDRRLAQRYRDTRLAAALSLGYVAGERRNERLLLASFTNTQQFTPWLDALAEAGTKLAGVYSVPLAAPALAARLGARGGRCFVISADRAGLRQCFVENGKLRFARLERTADMAPETLAAFVRSETMRLGQYLTTLRALPREGPPVQVMVVVPAGQKAAFERVLVSDARFAFHTFDLDEAARAAKVGRAPADMLAERLYLHLTVKQTPKEQFARREDRRGYVLWQLQRGIALAGAAGLAACVLYAGAKWLDVMSTRGQAARRAARGEPRRRALPPHHRRLPGDADHHRQPQGDGDRIPQDRRAHGVAGSLLRPPVQGARRFSPDRAREPDLAHGPPRRRRGAKAPSAARRAFSARRRDRSRSCSRFPGG